MLAMIHFKAPTHLWSPPYRCLFRFSDETRTLWSCTDCFIHTLLTLLTLVLLHLLIPGSDYMILLSVKMATVSDWAIIESKMIASTWPREVTDGMGVLGTDFWVQKYKQIMASKAPKKKRRKTPCLCFTVPPSRTNINPLPLCHVELCAPINITEHIMEHKTCKLFC